MKNNKICSWLLPMGLFFVVFLSVPISQMHGFSMMPGDIGDARLNNYFLENIYQYFFGNAHSLWHLPFFYPFPYVGGFSDNLFGSAPAYLLARLLTGQPDTAYQIWFLIGYVVNFAAAYYALRCLGGSRLASSVGALIFAFALPTTAHAGHAQLHYRFGVPLAITFFIQYLEQKGFRLLTIAGAWLTWQFYCGVYMGFFTILLLAVGTVFHFFYNRNSMNVSLVQSMRDFTTQWNKQPRHEKLKVFIFLTLLLAALVLLFYPYLQVSYLYGAKRSWGEIATMLPRLQSYFLSDASYLWSSPGSKVFAGIPMRHEHQMFIGVIPMLLAIIGFLIGSRKKNGHIFTLMVGSLGGVIGLTLYIGGFSLWFFLYKLPLFSAIRAITRLDQVLLFPSAYLAVITVDYLRSNLRWGTKLIAAIVLPLMVFEMSATSMGVSSKNEWRDRLSAKEAVVPKKFRQDSILFFAQNKGPFFADELDAMWVSLKHGVKTLNGYSGLFPPGYTSHFGDDCTELPKRVLSYLFFSGQGADNEAYFSLMNRVVPIGFEDCDPKWRATPLCITKIDRVYTADEIRNLSYRFVGRKYGNGQEVVKLKLLNSGNIPIAAQSGIGKPMRISWRFLDATGKAASGWDTRKGLPFDIPAKGDLTMRVPIDPKMEEKGGVLQISLVQEGIFWAHDIGVQPLTIPWE